MRYPIVVDHIAKKFWGKEGWQNLTWEAVSNDDNALRALYEDTNYHTTDVCYTELDDEEKMKYIRHSGAVSELKDKYCPVMNYVHILQETPRKKDVLKIHSNAPGIVVIKDDIGNHYLGLSEGGVGLQEELAYAYMVIDRCIPPGFQTTESSDFYLGKEAYKELVHFMNKNGD